MNRPVRWQLAESGRHEGVSLASLTGPGLSSIHLDSADPVTARRQAIDHGYERLVATCRQLGRPAPARALVDAAHGALSLVRMDASPAAVGTAQVFGADPIYRPRGLDYASLLDAIPAISIPAGKTSYNLHEGDVSGSWKVFGPGKSNALNPYQGDYNETAPLPVLTYYADLIEPDWLQQIIIGDHGVDHRPAELAALQRGALRTQYSLLTTGITGQIAYNLQTLPMARRSTASTWSSSMSDANVDTYTGEVITAIEEHRIAAPVAFRPRRAYVSSTLMALLAGRSAYAAGGERSALDLFRGKFAGIGINDVGRADWLNGIGGTGIHGVYLPMDEDAERDGYTGRVVAMSPTMVDSFQAEGRLVQRWALRIGGLVQPVPDGGLMVLVSAS